MNTILATVTSFLLVSTGAVPATIEERNLNTLSQVSNEIRIELDKVMSENYNKDDVIKTLKYNSGLLHSILNDHIKSITNYNDLNLRKIRLDQMLIATLYAMAINDILIYLENPDYNKERLFDALIELRYGNTVLQGNKVDFQAYQKM